MSSELTPQQVLPALPFSPLRLDLDEIQGDVLLGLQKIFERFVFFEIADVPAFKSALHDDISHRITTSRIVQLREFQLRDYKNQGQNERLSTIGLNVSFTNDGIQKLVPGTNLGDPSFSQGAKAQASSLGDPKGLTTWRPEFLNRAIDGVFLITGGTAAAVEVEAEAVLSVSGQSIRISFDETGHTRPGANRGHEHFGWQDGISQPGINGLTAGFPGQDMLDPGFFVFGYPRGSTPPQASLPTPLAWMKNGSFMVFRRLKQLVPEFNRSMLDQAQTLGVDPVSLGARMVGRWKSGAPLALTPSQDDTTLAADPKRNNNFDFADDQAQRRCPFSAHIRKTNPRKDIARDGLDVHRIIRAGIPFGPEVTDLESTAKRTQEERGLLFVCYQISIAQQFEFVQSQWANNPNFVFNKTRPSGGPVTVGNDPIIGQVSALADSPDRARNTDEPVPNYPTGNVRSTLKLPQDFVVPTGGGYFFVPSISALKNVLSV